MNAMKKWKDKFTKKSREIDISPVMIPERGFVLTRDGEFLLLNKEFHYQGFSQIITYLYPEESKKIITDFETDTRSYVALLQNRDNIVFLNHSIVHFGEYREDPHFIFTTIGSLYLPCEINKLSKEQCATLLEFLPDFERMRYLSIDVQREHTLSVQTLKEELLEYLVAKKR